MKIQMQIESRLKYNFFYHSGYMAIDDLAYNKEHPNGGFLEYQLNDFILRVDHIGNIQFIYRNNVSNELIRRNAQLFLGLISVCTDIICEYKKHIIIDDIIQHDFFSYIIEDHKNLNVYKDLKNLEIGIEELDVNILNKLFDIKKDHSLLSNCFIADKYYKDYPGSDINKFKNAVCMIEEMTNCINFDDYDRYYQKNKTNIKSFIIKIKGLSVLDKREVKEFNESILAKRRTLEKKLMDAISIISEIFNCKKNDQVISLCNKISNTRNKYSHFFFDDDETKYLNKIEMDNATLSLREMFRIIYLSNLGVKKEVIKNRFATLVTIHNLADFINI